MTILELGLPKSLYIPETDVLEVEFAGVTPWKTYVYGDLFAIHFGRRPSDASVAIRGMTIMGFKRLRERLHGFETEEDVQRAKEAADREVPTLRMEVKALGPNALMVVFDSRFSDMLKAWTRSGRNPPWLEGRHRVELAAA